MREPVIVVSGLPRSGTSMMMQMLDAGGVPVLIDNERISDEDNPRGYYEFERVKQVATDRAWLSEAEGKVVKMVYRLLYDLPDGYDYRVVFCTRRLEEVIASQDRMLARHGKNDGAVDRDQLVDIYRRQMANVRTWLADKPNFDVLYVDHRDVIDDTDRVAAEINHFLGGGLNTQAMADVPDGALYRQRA